MKQWREYQYVTSVIRLAESIHISQTCLGVGVRRWLVNRLTCFLSNINISSRSLTVTGYVTSSCPLSLTTTLVCVRSSLCWWVPATWNVTISKGWKKASQSVESRSMKPQLLNSYQSRKYVTNQFSIWAVKWWHPGFYWDFNPTILVGAKTIIKTFLIFFDYVSNNSFLSHNKNVPRKAQIADLFWRWNLTIQLVAVMLSACTLYMHMKWKLINFCPDSTWLIW